VQTGRLSGRDVYPSVGAVVSLFKGYGAGYKGLIPPYIVLTEPQGRFSEAGFLGGRYKPFATGGDPAQNRFAVEGVVLQGVSEDRQRKRREYLHQLDTLGQALGGDPQVKAAAEAEQQAYELILGDAGKVFDLSQEKDELRDRYGRTTFGQSCLVARRLVERGVPYITINYKGGWDTHKQNFQVMRQRLPQMDKGLATLLQDLAGRGLLESTIVWWNGEGAMGGAVEWRARSLGQRLLVVGGRRRLPRRTRGGRVRRARRRGEGPPGISRRPDRQHLRADGDRSRGRAAAPAGSTGARDAVAL